MGRLPSSIISSPLPNLRKEITEEIKIKEQPEIKEQSEDVKTETEFSALKSFKYGNTQDNTKEENTKQSSEAFVEIGKVTSENNIPEEFLSQ